MPSRSMRWPDVRHPDIFISSNRKLWLLGGNESLLRALDEKSGMASESNGLGISVGVSDRRVASTHGHTVPAYWLM
jgi:hypothetical protein